MKGRNVKKSCKKIQRFKNRQLNKTSPKLSSTLSTREKVFFTLVLFIEYTVEKALAGTSMIRYSD